MSNKTKTSSSFFNMVVTLVLIAVLSAFVLAKVELFTKEPIQKAKDQRELQAISEVVNEFDNNPFEERMIITTPNKNTSWNFIPRAKTASSTLSPSKPTPIPDLAEEWN